jgi:hypothetical protein
MPQRRPRGEWGGDYRDHPAWWDENLAGTLLTATLLVAVLMILVGLGNS